jgi:cold shock protein
LKIKQISESLAVGLRTRASETATAWRRGPSARLSLGGLPSTGGRDVFVHISALERAGLSNLNEGAKVSYEVMANCGKESADDLRVG